MPPVCPGCDTCGPPEGGRAAPPLAAPRKSAACRPAAASGKLGDMTDTGKTRAQQLLGDTAPDLVRLTDDVLFGEVWANPGLSPRDRSLVTVAALVALYRTDQLGSHLRRALDNGLSKDELVHAITHLAFYAGWPCAMTAITQLKQITEK